MVKIIGIELTPVHVPFKAMIQQALEASEGGVGMAIGVEETWLGADCVICQMHTDEGYTGLSEIFVWYPETGVAPPQIIDVVKNALANYVIGENPFNVERMLSRMNRNVARQHFSKGLLDMACYDLMGKVTGRPVCELIGGRTVETIPLCALIPLTDLDMMVELTKIFLKLGFDSFRVKLGRNLNDDITIINAIRNVIGPHRRIRVDYNQAYTPTDAVQAINAIEEYGIDVAEQPVPAEQFVGMAHVQERVHIPLMAHEGFFSLQDFVTLVELKAVGVLGVNSERPGGVTNALKAIAYAEALGMPVIIHNQPLGIGEAMHLHLAVAKYEALHHAPELFGHIMLEDDLIRTPLSYNKGCAKVPTAPGWGVELDVSKLEQYASAPTVLIGRSK
ncbi:MAG: mandelate racemase/muconate lactonizing enzyme family protein [Candidatus Helarchaeota archaeon]